MNGLGPLGELIPEPLLVISRSGRIIEANRAARLVFGLESVDSAATSMYDRVANSCDDVESYLRACSRTSDLLPGTLSVKTRHGIREYRAEGARYAATGDSSHCVFMRLTPKEAAVARFVALNQRIDELAGELARRTRAEQVLHESEQKLRLLANTIPQLAWIARSDGHIFWYNRRWYEYTGSTAEEMQGWGWQAVHDPEVLPDVLAKWRSSIATGEPFEMVFPLRGADGVFRPFLTRVNPLRGDDGRVVYWFGTNTDVSEIKRMEDALRDADRKKDEFLAMLAHELRNPLAPISNALQILNMPRLDAATAQQTRQIIERQVQHLVRLVDDLLDVSRVTRGRIELRREPVDLSLVAARGLETAQPLIAARGHRLEVSMPDEELLVEADPMRLAQVIGNLLTNAAKYTQPGGRIMLSASRENDLAVLRVGDDGIGIAPEVLPHVFELFVQAGESTARSDGGLGIGLTLVRTLVELHGGTVEARSAGLGCGAEFIIRLPLMTDASDTARPDASTASCDKPTSERVLVVDDNADAAESLALLLRLQGHDVRVACDGASALEIARSFRPAVMFLDIGMPGMDGYEVARRLRATPELRTTVIAALTGWGQKEDRRRTMQAGFDHHLVKPPSADDVQSVLAGRNTGASLSIATAPIDDRRP